jgi:protein involved in polysaccharide export with SLBB domain
MGAVPEFTLSPGDKLEIRFFFTSDLNQEVTVRPDGMINLDIIGEVEASGKTISELSSDLVKRYSTELLNPDISVRLESAAPVRVYIAGEVKSPGIYTIEGELTTLQAIFAAGGITENGKLSSVIVLRKDSASDTGGKIMKINLAKVIKGSNKYFDFPLQQYDVVYVPRTRIASVDLFVDKYIRKVIPVSMNAGFTYVKQWTPGVE